MATGGMCFIRASLVVLAVIVICDSAPQGSIPDWRPFTIKPYTFRPFTFKPITWRPFTVKPFTWRPFTVKPFTWRPFTFKPFTWKPFRPLPGPGPILPPLFRFKRGVDTSVEGVRTGLGGLLRAAKK